MDSQDDSQSILKVQSVSFSKLGAKPTLTAYLDDFPFPYYIVLRDIRQLPGLRCNCAETVLIAFASLAEIVADALRQWFELIRSSSA